MTEAASILEEAQALMDEMAIIDDGEGADDDADGLVIDGFSIDSDDENENKNKGSGIDARTIKVEAGEDPLTALGSVGTGTQSAGAQRGGTSTPTSLHPLQGAPKTPTMATGSAVNSVSLADVKARASGFASSVATLAQKAASSMAQAASDAAKQTNAVAAAAAVVPNSPQPQPRNAIELDNDQKQSLIRRHIGTLLPGEQVIMFLSNLLHVADSAGYEYSGVWHCCMTFYRVVLFDSSSNGSSVQVGRGSCPVDWDPECWPTLQHEKPTLLQMPLTSLDRIEKSVYSTSAATTLMGLVLYGKDSYRQLRFCTPSYPDTLRVQESIQTYAFPGRRNLGYLFAFESKRQEVMNSIVVDATGKKSVTLQPFRARFQAVQEFNRQFGHMQPCPWAIYENINGSSYNVCMSYPSVICGPSSLPEQSQETQRVIRQVASFRSEQRFPALTWSSGKDGASIWRASQPRVGLQGNRNQADEFYLRQIMDSATSANRLRSEPMTLLDRETLRKLTGQVDGFTREPGVNLKIMDMRPRASAMANRTQGYGYENTSHYSGTTLQFCNIGNIHAVRDSHQKLSNLCNSPTASDATWMSAVEDTKWLNHIRLILSASWETAFWVHVHRLPVLLHCSHGWDRTSQVAALAQLMLDPFYRTMDGFVCLIEKDFLSFGHPFHTRCGHGEGRGSDQGGSGDDGQISPIFLQFLDCVWQLVKLFPERFEFNTMYLLVLSEHIYSCRFGNLLCDTERERDLVAGIRQRTHSVWDYLESRPDCKNTNFQPGKGVMLIPLPLLLRNVSLWTERHCLYGPKISNRNRISPNVVVPLNLDNDAT